MHPPTYVSYVVHRLNFDFILNSKYALSARLAGRPAVIREMRICPILSQPPGIVLKFHIFGKCFCLCLYYISMHIHIIFKSYIVSAEFLFILYLKLNGAQKFLIFSNYLIIIAKYHNQFIIKFHNRQVG